MAVDFGPHRGSWTTITITLASLASDSSLLAGRQSNEVDFTGNLSGANVPCRNAHIDIKFTTGTSPTAGSTVELWAAHPLFGTTYPDNITNGGDANVSISSRNALQGLRQVGVFNVDAPSNKTYSITNSLLAVFGFMPEKVVFWVVHGTGAAFNSTGSNHVLKYQAETEQGA